MDAVTSASLKRRFEEVDVGSPISTPKDSDDEISNSDSADSCDSLNPPTTTGLIPTSILKRQKLMRRKNVRFDQVTVYYFPRRQGFTSVPSQGGSSLGMAQRHNSIRQYTLCEFAQEQEVSHRQILREHLKVEKLRTRKLKLTKNGTIESEEAEVLTLEDVSDDDIDVDNVEVDNYFFLQPLPTKRRRALLRASGVHRIDAEEKQELRAIRLSREECGCHCRLYCDPEACPCSQAGIKCQVDRMSFPCGCSRDGCSNLAGRIEFNPIRVRTHYLHTIMKLELENKRPPTRLPSQEEVSPQGFTCDSSCTLPPETQDFQEFIAENCHLENETAVRHLQSAEEMARLKEEEDEDSSTSSLSLDSSVESLGVCLLEEPLAGPGGVIDSLASSPVLLDAKLPLGSSVLCFTGSSDRATPSVGDQTFISNTPVVYYQIGQNSVLSVRGQEVSETAENPSSYLKEKDFNIFPVLGNTQEEPATVHQQESGQCCLGAECVFSEGCRSPLVAGTDPDSLCSLRNMQLPIHIGDGESTGGPARERSVPELRRETTCHLSEISKPQVEAMHGGNALAV
ncbi:cysteine/serine-rich nuclear protein 2 isoform X1 [Ambystoma mexicanum]|uniref:cysteine/serine-rich nuclear protein 2 isoform X1 n=1 Tax=Ambystoma mexicanum TaxID=8296 RepID=UPI0037E9BAF2